MSGAAVWRGSRVVWRAGAKLDTRIGTNRRVLRTDLCRADSDLFEVYRDVMVVWRNRRRYYVSWVSFPLCARNVILIVRRYPRTQTTQHLDSGEHGRV